MKKILYCTIIAMLLLAPIALAGGLEITEVEVKINGDKEDVSRGENVDIKLKDITNGKPLNLKIKVEVSNTFTKAENIDIKDVEVEITIKDFDDGDDEEDSEDADDIDAGDDETVNFDFEVPIDIGEDTYDVDIIAEGKDKNQTRYVANFSFVLEVDKEKHSVIFIKKELSKSTIKCGQSTDLTATVINIGQEDEEDTILEVSNAELGLNERSVFDLEQGEFDDDMKETKTYRIATSEEVEPAVYPIQLRVTFDDGDKSVSETLDLTVESCEPAAPEVPEEEEEEEEDEDEDVVVNIPPPPQLVPPVTGLTVEPVAEAPSFLDSYGVALVVLLYAIVIAVAVLVFVFVFKRPSE